MIKQNEHWPKLLLDQWKDTYETLHHWSKEVSSAGFWPGAGLGEAAFYAYAYPEPNGFMEYPVRPDAAYYHQALREFILPYEAVRTAKEPDIVLLDFLFAGPSNY